MKAVEAAFNQEKALVGAFSVLTNLRMELFQALMWTRTKQLLLMRPKLGRDMCVCGCYGHRFHFKYPYWFTNYTSFGLLASLDLQINIQPPVGEEAGDRGSAGIPISGSVTPSSVETQFKCGEQRRVTPGRRGRSCSKGHLLLLLLLRRYP